MIHIPDWSALFLHFGILSLFSVGGPMGLIPDIHRYLVTEHGWISNAQFTDSIVIAQASPGPNILFLALLGWNMGLQAGGYFLGAWAAETFQYASKPKLTQKILKIARFNLNHFSFCLYCLLRAV